MNIDSKLFGLLTIPEQNIVRVLQSHKGEENAIPACELARAVKMDMRELRKKVNRLIVESGIEIASKAGKDGGYFLVATGPERQRFNQAFMTRAATGVAKAAAIAKASIVEVGLEMAIERHEAQHAEPGRHKLTGLGKTASKILTIIFENPKTYAREIAELRREHSAVIIGKTRMMQINRMATELKSLTDGFSEAA